MEPERTVNELRVTVTQKPDRSAHAQVWVRLRHGGLHPAASMDWPAGAPTPEQLELFRASVDDELQKLILTTCGVQGVLYAEGRE